MSWAAPTCSSCTCTERCACVDASAVHLVARACSAAASRVCTLTRSNAQLPVECTEADAMHAMCVHAIRFAHECSAERTPSAGICYGTTRTFPPPRLRRWTPRARRRQPARWWRSTGVTLLPPRCGASAAARQCACACRQRAYARAPCCAGTSPAASPRRRCMPRCSRRTRTSFSRATPRRRRGSQVRASARRSVYTSRAS